VTSRAHLDEKFLDPLTQASYLQATKFSLKSGRVSDNEARLRGIASIIDVSQFRPA
jgi:hypothetical protein